jgi:hypothetical protein
MPFRSTVYKSSNTLNYRLDRLHLKYPSASCHCCKMAPTTFVALAALLCLAGVIEARELLQSTCTQIPKCKPGSCSSQIVGSITTPVAVCSSCQSTYVLQNQGRACGE